MSLHKYRVFMIVCYLNSNILYKHRSIILSTATTSLLIYLLFMSHTRTRLGPRLPRERSRGRDVI